MFPYLQIKIVLWILFFTIFSPIWAQVDLICPIDRVNLENTKNCLQGRINQSPTFVEEEVTQLARVLLMMKKFDDAQALLKKFPKLTANYVEIRILAAWYQKKFKQVDLYYRYYQSKGIKVEQIESVQYPLVVSLWELNKKSEAKKQKNKSLEIYPHNKQLKSLELSENYQQVIFDYYMYSESDKRSLSSSNLEYIYQHDDLVLQPGYEFYNRDYSTEKLTDANFKLMTKFHTSSNKWLNFGYQHSLSNVFIARNTYLVQSKFQVKNHHLILDTTFKDFRKYNALLFKIRDEINLNHWKFFGSVQILSNNFDNRVWLLGTSYISKLITPTAWVSFGQSDPSRPYLTRDLDETFKLYGITLSKTFFSSWQIQFQYEHRTEKDYSYSMSGLNMAVTF